jgi:hypothetical protein
MPLVDVEADILEEQLFAVALGDVLECKKIQWMDIGRLDVGLGDFGLGDVGLLDGGLGDVGLGDVGLAR